MKYRKGINISDATERELLRWQMEKVVKDSDSLEYSPGKWSASLARLNDSLEKSYSGFFLRLMVCIYSFIGLFVLVIKIFGRERG